jgi:cytochrome b561
MPTKLEHHETGAMLFHWSIATLVFGVGLTSPLLDHRTWPALSTFHNFGGGVVMVLAMAWFIWRTTRPSLPKLAGIDPHEQWLMNSANRALDVLLILAPVSGIIYLLMLRGSHEFLPVQWNHSVGIVHHVLGALLVVIAGAHSLHSVWHHVMLGDGLLARMLPGHDRR